MTSLRSASVDRRTALTGLATSLSCLGLAGCLDASEEDGDEEPTANANSEDDASSTAVHADYESTDVRVTTPDGDELGAVTAAIADRSELRTLGLSDTDDLPDDRGMLFVYESVEERRFVMREMSFGIDIIFADDEGIITSIAHAPEPGPDEDGAEQTYPGRGQYVLEVVYEWTAERGIEAGDVLHFDL